MSDTKEVTAKDVREAEIRDRENKPIFKSLIPMLVRMSTGDSTLTKTNLERLHKLRNALGIKDAPSDEASLEDWGTWSTAK